MFVGIVVSWGYLVVKRVDVSYQSTPAKIRRNKRKNRVFEQELSYSTQVLLNDQRTIVNAKAIDVKSGNAKFVS